MKSTKRQRGVNGSNKLGFRRYYLSKDLRDRAIRRKMKKRISKFQQEQRHDILTPVEKFIIERKSWPKRNSKSARFVRRIINHMIKTKGIDMF